MRALMSARSGTVVRGDGMPVAAPKEVPGRMLTRLCIWVGERVRADCASTSTTLLPAGHALRSVRRQQLEPDGEQGPHDARMRIHAVGVVDGAVAHREHAPARAHGDGRLEV